MSEPKQLTSPIVHTPRAELRELVRSELKALGVRDILIPQSSDNCIELLVKHGDAILVLDWELGDADVNSILSAAKGHHRVETRPIFLVVPEHSAHFIGVATDYGVSQLHAGPVSRLGIKESLVAMIEEDDATRELRDTLIKVAECRARGDWRVATEVLSDLYEKMNGSERIALELADNLIHEEQWDAVVAVLAPIARKDPPNVRALHLFGRALMRKGDFEAAIALLERAKIINPLNVDRLIDLGNAFLSNGQVDEAMEEFKEAKALDPENKEASVGESKCLLMNGEVNEALMLLKTISGPREMASIFNTAAVLSMRGEKFEKAMSLYKSALAALGKDRPLAARLHFNVGLGYRRWQKFDKAIAHLKKSLELDPTYEKAKAQLDKVQKLLAGAPGPTAAMRAAAGAGGKQKDKDFSDEELSLFNRPAAAKSGKAIIGHAAEDDNDEEGDLSPIDWEPDE
jgi:tetratricopeptide (TPR) repeat protein